MKKITSCLLLSGIMFVSINGVSHAGDGKGYNGSFCQPAYGTNTSNFNHTTGGVLNIGTYSNTVICPAIKDNVGSTSGTSDSFVQISRSSATTNPFYCWLQANTPGGSTSYVSFNYTRVTGNSTLRMNVPGGYGKGNYVFRCIVPPKSLVRSYYIEE